MRLDEVSGWQLLLAQIAALIGIATMMLVVGVAFRRSRFARWASMLAAAGVGAGIAAGILRADESVVSAWLFAATVFMMGTVMMAVLLLAAIPQTRGAALGGMVAGVVMVAGFVLTYYALFTFTPVKWLTNG
jgi:hypothetical protein